MKLHEIISTNEDIENSISFEVLQPYLKSLYSYYKDFFCCEPILMVTDVFNACSYAKIVSSNDFNEILEDYTKDIEDHEERESSIETINFNSQMLSDMIPN
jgi:hypothetical protein